MYIQIHGTTLNSLRKRYKATYEGASKMTGIDAKLLEQWEKEGVEVSLTDAKKLAKGFHSHWSVFLLKSRVKPIEEPVNHRAGYDNSSPFSDKTMHAYEVARRLLDTSEQIEGQVVDPRLEPIRKLGQSKENPEFVAKKVRELMGITSEDILRIKGSPYVVYAFWKRNVSRLGIYISEQEMPITETKAFLMKDRDRAVIVVNKKDTYIYSRIFSLMHELGHLVKGEDSAACKITEHARRSSSEETWCNKFASEILAYDGDVMANKLVGSIKSSPEPSTIVRKLASQYKVSFTVMLYKLKRHGKVTDQQCREMQAFFENVILPKFKPKKDADIKLGRAFYVNRDISKASPSLSREVIERQVQGKVSYSQAAKMLDTRAKYLEDLKSVVGFGS